MIRRLLMCEPQWVEELDAILEAKETFSLEIDKRKKNAKAIVATIRAMAGLPDKRGLWRIFWDTQMAGDIGAQLSDIFLSKCYSVKPGENEKYYTFLFTVPAR